MPMALQHLEHDHKEWIGRADGLREADRQPETEPIYEEPACTEVQRTNEQKGSKLLAWRQRTCTLDLELGASDRHGDCQLDQREVDRETAGRLDSLHQARRHVVEARRQEEPGGEQHADGHRFEGLCLRH